MKFLGSCDLLPLKNLYEDYNRKLQNTQEDSVKEPYRSKYNAIAALEDLQEKLNNLDEESQHVIAIQAGVLVAYGQLKADTEELTLAEKCLCRCLELCEKVPEEKFSILTSVAARIQLGILWFAREDMTKSKGYLEDSLKVSETFLATSPPRPIFTLKDLLSPEEHVSKDQASELQSLLTHAYYYLAQVEGKLGNTEKSAELCHTTLSRQLTDRDNLDWIPWTGNCATLSQFYILQGNYERALYHLAAAVTVQGLYREKELAQTPEDETENFRRNEGEIQRLCGKYGLSLLQISNPELDNRTDLTTSDTDNISNFENLDVSNIVNKVKSTRISDQQTAQDMFNWAKKNFTDAQQYFTFEEKCSDYVEIAREVSQLYKHVMAFETDNDRKCKILRRRADLLEPIKAELSPIHYQMVIRQILFELGEIYSDMVDLKRERWTLQPSNLQYATKVNHLVVKGAIYFQEFLNTMQKDGRDPDKYTDDNVRPALLCNFYLGRLASKFIVKENSPEHIKNMQTTYRNYKRIVDYCQENPLTVDRVREELDACTEMVRLLPIKIEKMKGNPV